EARRQRRGRCHAGADRGWHSAATTRRDRRARARGSEDSAKDRNHRAVVHDSWRSRTRAADPLDQASIAPLEEAGAREDEEGDCSPRSSIAPPPGVTNGFTHVIE